MDLSSKLNEIKKFCEDVRAYLKDDADSIVYQNRIDSIDISREKNEKEEEKENLLLDCEKVLSYIEDIIKLSACGGVCKESAKDAENAYLDMTSGNKKLTSCRALIETNNPTNELADSMSGGYVVINASSKPELPDTGPCNDTKDKRLSCLVETSKSVDDAMENQNCPYSGLPAAHIAMKNPIRQGQLTRVEKRKFFGQSKKYFSGIVGDWLLCYADGPTSLKPSLCVHLTAGTQIDRCGEGKRREMCFQILTLTGKRYVFQSCSEIETAAWIQVIDATIQGINRPILENHHVTSKSLLAGNQLSVRKLIPPPELENCVFDGAESYKASHEDIYEEPCPLYTELREIEDSNVLDLKIIAETCVVTNTGREAINFENYDVPRKLHSPIEVSTTLKQEDNNGYDHIETKPVTVKSIQEKLFANSSLLTQTTTETHTNENQTKRHESNASKENHNPVRIVETSVTSQSIEISCDQGNQTQASPVRNWFLNKFNKTSPNQQWISNHPHNSSKVSPKRLTKTCESKNSTDGSVPIERKGSVNGVLVASAKGEKVNMIVNQLMDANGGLPIFRNNEFNMLMGTNSEKQCQSVSTVVVDDSNYELINIFNSP